MNGKKDGDGALKQGYSGLKADNDSRSLACCVDFFSWIVQGVLEVTDLPDWVRDVRLLIVKYHQANWSRRKSSYRTREHALSLKTPCLIILYPIQDPTLPQSLNCILFHEPGGTHILLKSLPSSRL